MISPALLGAVRAIGEHSGREELYAHRSPEVLETLRAASIIASTESSNRLEGVTAPHERIEDLVVRHGHPQNRSEMEIAGYGDVLGTIHANWPVMQFSLGYGRRLSSSWGVGVAGELSTTDVERAWLLNVPVYFYPAGGLGLKAGPVLEGSDEASEDGEDSERATNFGVRFGAAWEFEVGERFTLSPEVNLDLVGGSVTWVYGLTLGLGF